MSKKNKHPLPLKEDELLFQAAFLEGDKSLEAWSEWRSLANLNDHLSPDAFRMLPQLFRNLQKCGVEDSSMMKFKGAARQNWLSNQVLFNSISDPLRALSSAGIDVVVIYGPALASWYFPDHYLDPALEFPIVVRPKHADMAAKQLLSHGFIALYDPPVPERDLQKIFPSSRLYQDQAKKKIRLYWHFLPKGRPTREGEDFWDKAMATTIHDVPVLRLDPTDQLLHVCLQQDFAYPISLLRRATDVMLVLKSSRFQIDWDRVAAHAQKHWLVFQVTVTLGYIQDTLNTPLPEGILDSMRNLPTYKGEETEHRLKQCSLRTIRRVAEVWFGYARLSMNTNGVKRVWEFLHYLKRRWQLKRLRQLPLYPVLWGIRNIWGQTHRFF